MPSYTFRQPAPEGERYAPDAFERNIGRTYEAGVLTKAEVSEDGTYVMFTLTQEMNHVTCSCGVRCEHSDAREDWDDRP